jgi:hypothetical protein
VRLIRGLLLASLLAAALTVGAGAATPRVQDGTLTVRDGHGSMAVKVRGSVIGRLGKGALTVTDAPSQGATIVVRGAERTRYPSARTTVYSGKNIRFRVAHTRPVVVQVNGKAINFSAVGRGDGWMDGRGDPTAGIFFDGAYSLNGQPFQSLPDLRTRFDLLLPPPPPNPGSGG